MIGYFKRDIYYAIQLLPDNKEQVKQFIEDHKLKNFRIKEPDKSTKDIFRYEFCETININGIKPNNHWVPISKGNFLVTAQMSMKAFIEDTMDKNFIEVTLEYDINGKKC